MRLNMTTQGGLADEFMSGGGSVINPLILAGNPVQPQEAATKQYVDNSLLSLNANNLISGTISGGRFPAMNGDFTSTPGTVNLILSNTGVVAGNYAKVSVDNKGRVVNGLPLIESDIPSFSWNKVTTDKPNTLAGYGITDALALSGGTMTGALSISDTVTASNQLANKTYLDAVVGGATGIAVGDIISKVDAATPTGFLKCNGAELDKSTYSSLYSAIGDTYTLSSKAGNGQPWRNQYEINTENFGDISNVTTIQSLPGVLGGGATFVTKNRVYVFGGFNGSSHVGTGYTAAINNDGTIGPWGATAALPTAYAYSTAVVIKNKVYLLGGYINNTTATANIFVADINADGTIGTWGNGPAMPSATAYSHAFINNKRIYVVGGYSGSPLNVLWSVDVKEDGSLGTWVTEAPLPVTYYSGAVVCIKNRVFLVGGYQNGSASSSIYSAPLNSDGSIGAWTLYSSLPVTVGLPQAVVTRNVIYLIGGTQNGSHSAAIYKAPINTDGSIGVWQLEGWTLPAVYNYGNVTIIKNHIYFIGGMGASSVWNGTVFMGDITGGLNDYSAFYSMSEEQNFMVAGSGKPWQQQYQINATQTDDITGWITDSSVLPQALYSASVVVTKNKVYLIGGHNGTSSVSTVFSSVINTDGMLSSWTAETSIPAIVSASSAVTVGNRVYLIGGSNTAFVGLNTVYTTVINADGTLGTWSLYGTLPAPMHTPAVFITRNKIHVVGGYHNGVLSTVYTASIYPDGILGTWTTGVNLPGPLYQSSVIITKNRVYICGGMNSTSHVSTVYTTTINSDGSLGTWKTDTSLPTAFSGSSVFVSKNKAYLLGGYNGTAYTSTVYSAPINSDGVIGTWVAGTSIPGALVTAQLFSVNNKVYILAGNNGTAPSSVIYSASILEGSNDYSSYYAEDTTNYLMPGSGKPWQQQYQINTTQSVDITGWTVGTSLPAAFSNSQAIVTKNRVYLLGGGTGGVYVSTVYTAPINADGTLGTWVTGTSLPVALGNTQTFVIKNRVYLCGGWTGGSYVSTVYTAPINSDGTLGTWVATTSLPVALSNSNVVITKNRVYLISGAINGTGTANIYTAIINTDGTLGGWNSSGALPGILGSSSIVATKNRIYICGGSNGSTAISTVYTAQINTDGTLGSWSTSGALPVAYCWSCSVVTKNRAYLFGGYNGTSYLGNVYIAPINSDGTLGAWTTGTSLPGVLALTQAILTKDRIYLLGGNNSAGNNVNTVYTATINSDINDYSPYYDGSITAPEQFITVAKFKLPDSSYMNDGLNYFIKY